MFDHGRVVFETPLTIDDGLGPIMNEISCAVCHASPRTGGASTTRVVRFGKAAGGGLPFDPLANLGGSLLQEQAIDPICLESVPSQADVVIERQTPIVFGIGLVEAIDDADIIAGAQNQQLPLMGYARMVQPLEDPSGPMRVGRFGWKGGVSTVTSFSIDASLNEMGLTSPFAPNENAPNGDQGLLAQCDTVPDPEDKPGVVGLTFIEHFDNFQRFSAPPPQTPKLGMTGETVFTSVGCAACHVPEWTTSQSAAPGFANRTIKPYSDFLVHNMGSLGDGIVDGDAQETEMMTRTLWGLRSRSAFLHDGRAEGGTFEDNARASILAHDGEAADSRINFMNLSVADENALYAFLDSLGREEFDFEGDHDVDFFDWFFIEPSFNGPTSIYTPDDPESINDIEGDGDFDLHDYLVVQQAYTGELSAASTPRIVPSKLVTEMSVTVQSGGALEVWVVPGATVPYEVIGETTTNEHEGLAGFSFDLVFDGGPLAQAADPTSGPMLAFFAPDGISNPAGFGGTPVAGDLVQVGGGQNTIANTFAPKPVGSVVEGVALPGAGATLVSGTLTAPQAAGTYRLSVSDLRANVLSSRSSAADPFWFVDLVDGGVPVDLIVNVLDCGSASFCSAKVSSQGCVPAIASTGAPTLTGPDDFHVTASNIVDGQNGLMFWGMMPDNTPLFGGTLCVGGTLTRTAVQLSGGAAACGGSFDHHFTQTDMANAGLTVGTTVFAQFWYRDPQHPDGFAIGLTDGLAFAICP
ncbi:MAG: hypothetical protein GY711_16240 [bacterium]|nr:hypothetical protein [bacterium]